MFTSGSESPRAPGPYFFLGQVMGGPRSGDPEVIGDLGCLHGGLWVGGLAPGGRFPAPVSEGAPRSVRAPLIVAGNISTGDGRGEILLHTQGNGTRTGRGVR